MIISMACPKHGYVKGDTCPKCNKEYKDNSSPLGSITVIGDEMKKVITSDITGEPVELTSKSQKRKLLKRHGLIEYSPNSKAKNRKERPSVDENKAEWRNTDEKE